MKTRQVLISGIVAILFINFSAQAQWWSGIKGEGEVVEKQLDIAPFSKLSMNISGNLFIEQGSSQSVRVKAQPNIIENLRKEVKNDRWKISFKNNVKQHKTVNIYVTVRELDALGLSGSGSVESKGLIKTGDFELYLSGSGEVNLLLEADDLETGISGSGDIVLSGKVNDHEIAISGSGDVHAYGLTSNNCEISISGSGDTEVNVNSTLEVSVSGSGDVSYKGNPKVDASVSGSGDVEPAN